MQENIPEIRSKQEELRNFRLKVKSQNEFPMCNSEILWMICGGEKGFGWSAASEAGRRSVGVGRWVTVERLISGVRRMVVGVRGISGEGW
ncbi:hypothetical protein HanPI659440_Chr17g0667261 [Helianthus annuus]|nr:hypothetical protein HanPI659440_Chr17g0667261 [Helianthus annuus]